MQADQTLDCSLAARSAVVHYSARLSNLPPEAFQHRLTVTPQLRIKRLIVVENGRPIAARWAQEPDGTAVVLLAQPPAAEQRVEVEAELLLPREQRRIAIPLVRYLGAASDPLTVRIDRQPDVLVTLQPPPKTWKQLAEPGLGQFREGLGRLVATLEQLAGAAAPPPVVTIAPNQPETTGRLVVRVDRDAAGWYAVAECLLDVSGGQLDLIRLQIPPHWTGPIETVPAVEQRVLSVPGETTRHLVIRPQRAVAGPLRLSIRGPLRGNGAELVAVPDVALLDAPRVERIVVLPGRIGSQRLAWETSGLQAAVPANLALPEGMIPTGCEAYQVVAPRYAAAARLLDRPATKPAVRLADYELHAAAGGHLIGRARFDLGPASTGK